MLLSRATALFAGLFAFCLAVGPTHDLFANVTPPGRSHLRIAFAWADNPTASDYAPASAFVRQDDTPIRITRQGTGRYLVAMGSLLASRGNVQVTAYGPGTNRCQVASWSAAGASVLCFDPNGRPSDATFTVLGVLAGPGEAHVSYAWVDALSAAASTPNAAYAHAPGASPRVTRSSAGSYEVALSPSVLATGATLQVTPYGTEPRLCTVRSWGAGTARINCSDLQGQPADTRFSLLALTPQAGHDDFQFVWNDQPSTPSSTPDPLYTHVPGTTPLVTRTGDGRYSVALGRSAGNVLVTTYATPGVSCSPLGWSPTSAQVTCTGPGGQPQDARFLVLATQRSTAPAQPTAQPDLLVRLEGTPGTLAPGGSLGLGARAVAVNEGAGLAAGNRPGQRGYVVDVVLSTDGTVPEGFAVFNESFREDVLLRGGRASNTTDLASGASTPLNIENDQIPADTPPGTYSLCARIDPGGAVAEANETNNVACRSLRVTGAPAPPPPSERGITLASSKGDSPITLTLQERFYSNRDRIRAGLDLGSAASSSDVEGVLVVSEETGDVEHLVMRRREGSLFVSTDESVVRLATGAAGRAFDGTLTARSGDRIVALFYPDSGRHRGAGADIVADVALYESATGRTDLGNAPLLPVRTEPQLASITREIAAPGERPLGTFAVRGGVPVHVATEEVVFRPKSAADLDAFLAFSGGTVRAHQPADALSEGVRPENRSYLVQIDPDRARPDRLADLRRLFGEPGELLISDDGVRSLYAFLLEARLRGFAASANPKVMLMEEPTPNETRSGALTSTMQRITPGVDVPAAWAFNALWDGDESRVNVGIVDMGFITDHPDLRRPASGDMTECDFDGGFTADILARRGHCGTGRAAGIPTVGNSLFGDRSWHGTGVAVTIGGVLNNTWRPGGATTDVGGGAGVAGQVAVPMLYKTGLTSYVYEMGAAMRQAVDDGASCINISAGYPCRVQSAILPDVDLCAPGGREGLCGAVFAAASAAAAAACTAAAAAAAIPIVGPLIAPPLFAICGAATTAAATSLPACLTFFLASGDVRGAMRSGAEYAAARGVPVVASGGNRISSIPPGLSALIDATNVDAGAWGIIPASLPEVIGVGAVGPTSGFPNQHFAGAALEIWAPQGTRFHAPDDVTRVPSSIAAFNQKSIGATSSAAPFVTGVIANMQAINPALDPRTPGLTDAQRRAIPGQIRSILRSTAVPSPDPLVARVVSPNRAIAEAARLAGVPATLPGYDTALNFDGSDVGDRAGDARDLAFGTTVTGTILTLRGEGTADQRDEDWYRIQFPSTPASGYFRTRARLRMPTASRWGRLDLGSAFTEESRREVSASETEVVYTIDRIAPGRTLAFPVRGIEAEDNVYRLTVETPTREPIASGAEEGSTPRLDAWTLVSETAAAKTWELRRSPEPTFHVASDTDTFVIAALPPTYAYTTSTSCQPQLEITHPHGVQIEYRDNTGRGPFTFDPARRERASLPTPAGETGHPVSILRFATRSSIPTEMTLTYSLAPSGVPTDYPVRLAWITVEVGASGFCG